MLSRPVLGALTLVIAGVPLTALGATVMVGETRLEIPPPAGFVELTPDFGRAYEYQRQGIPRGNDELAMFLPEEDAPAVLQGDILPSRRFFRVQVAKELAPRSVGSARFAELKASASAEAEKLSDAARHELPELFERASKAASDAVGSDVKLTPGRVLALPVHEDTQHALANSMFMSMTAEIQGSEETPVTIAGTSTLIHARDKVLFLYCYGSEGDLDWTRRASHAWAAEILRLNPPSESTSVAHDAAGPFLSSRAAAQILVGAVVALVSVLLSLLRRRQSASNSRGTGRGGRTDSPEPSAAARETGSSQPTSPAQDGATRPAASSAALHASRTTADARWMPSAVQPPGSASSSDDSKWAPRPSDAEGRGAPERR